MSKEEVVKLCQSWDPKGMMILYDWLLKAAGEPYRLPKHLYPLVLGLCDWRIKRLMQIVGPGSGKSMLLSQIFPTAVIGRDPTQNIICVSGAEDLAQGFQNTVMDYVENNEAFKIMFPNVRPDKNRGWSSSSGMFVSGRRSASPDATYWAAGLSSKALTGKHGTLLIFDDLHDAENSATEDQCKKVVTRYVTQLSGRADPMRARFLIAGRRWHVNDLYGTLKDNGDWVVLTLPAERAGSTKLWYDIVVPEGIECVFTDGMCMSPDGELIMVHPTPLDGYIKRRETKESGVVLRHIEWPYGDDPKGQGFFWPDAPQKRDEYFSNKRLRPSDTEAVYQCNPGTRQGVVFLDDDFERRFDLPENADMGVQSTQVKEFLGTGSMVIQSWDTAFSSNASSDHSVCVTLLLVPCDKYHRGEDEKLIGPCDAHFDIYVLDIWRDHATFAEVTQKMREMYQRWQPYMVVIEKKAYAVTAIEQLENSGMPIDAVMPNSLESKRARAIEGVGAGSVQGWARQWRIRIPLEASWVDAFIREMKDFTGARGNTDDQVDALVHGVRWAIQNGGASAGLPKGWNTPEQAEKSMKDLQVASDPFSMALSSIINGGDLFNPFADCCGHCKYYSKVVKLRSVSSNKDTSKLPANICMLHNRITTDISSCDDHAEVGDMNSHPFYIS